MADCRTGCPSLGVLGMKTHASLVTLLAVAWFASAPLGGNVLQAQESTKLPSETLAAMKKAAEFYSQRVAVRGGYVYYTASNLQQRWGEGVATPTQIWVQPPGTPTVGLAYVAAYRATGDELFKKVLKETAAALIFGQLESGGWSHAIDFDPKGSRAALYRNGKGNPKGRNYSTLDDGVTQSAVLFLMRADEALHFEDPQIHAAAKLGLDSLLAAQFPNGAFPQGWKAPAAQHPVIPASFPNYDWKTEERVKDYWDLYTLNDGLAGDVVETLLAAHAIYRDDRTAKALAKLGDFLILAQLPEPQPAWAQQYTFAMRPAWARKFEPPAITGSESQDVIAALLAIYQFTGDSKYLAPIPRALNYLKKSEIAPGRLARFYELQTNKPLYMTREYQLTYSGDDVPTHYGFKVDSKVENLQKQYEAVRAAGAKPAAKKPGKPSERVVREILASLDDQGRWITSKDGQRLVGQPKFSDDEKFLSSAVFSKNLTVLANFVGNE